MNQELQRIANRLALASAPEEVFGDVHTPDEEMSTILQRKYRAIARVVHPDMYQAAQEQTLAQQTFYLLTDWLERAREKLRWGEYGSPANSSRTILRTRKREYAIPGTHVERPIFSFYPCSFVEDGQAQRAILKIVRDPRDNNYIEHEVRALRLLARGLGADRFFAYFPNLIDTFIYETSGVERHALVLEQYEGWYSLEDVHRAYPDGIDPKDMAWIWRRLLVVLGFAHANKIVHGAVLPRNIWILPEEHGLLLVNWHCAVLVDPVSGEEPIRGILSEDAIWYPREVLKGESVLFGTDIQMSAKCMLGSLGGDLQKGSLPNSVPTPIHAFLKGCMLPGTQAPQNAWTLKEEFDELIERLWGERKFHPFYMK